MNIVDNIRVQAHSFLSVYLIEKFKESGVDFSDVGGKSIELLDELIAQELDDPEKLLLYINENLDGDNIVNELKKNIVKKQEYFRRKAFLLNLQVLLIQLKDTKKDLITKE